MSSAVLKQPVSNGEDLVPGEWYLRYTCVHCETKQILFRDLTRGNGGVSATYMIACPACHKKEAYESQDIERYHHSV